MTPSIIEIGTAVGAWLINCVALRYVGDLAEQLFKYKIIYLDPDGPDRQYSKWSWEFWR